MTVPKLLPYLFKRYGQHNMVRMVDPAMLDLGQPFFRQSLESARPSEALVPFDEWLAAQEGPDQNYSDFAGIFHVSRCGSTLLARNIRQSGQAVVLSEPPFFRILRHRMVDTVSSAVALRACLAMLGAWRSWARHREKRLVVKFNSQLHLHRDDLFANMPGARFVFLHRAPLPVLESLHRKPPLYLQQAITTESVTERIELLAHVDRITTNPLLRAAASRYCAALACFADLAEPCLLAVRYEELEGRYSDILAHLGLESERAPLWVSHGDAKARAGDHPSAYIPVGERELAEFAATHAGILAYTEARYQAFLATQPRATAG